MSEPTDPNASFDLRSDPKCLDFDGSVAQLQNQLRALTAPVERAGRIHSIVSSVAVLAGLVAAVFHYVIAFDLVGWIPQGEVPAWLLPVALGLFGVGVLIPWLARSGPRSRLDSRKLGLVEALLAYLERELPPTASVILYVDFASARRAGAPRLSHSSFAWSGLALPDSEPVVHDWLRLRVPLGELVLDMRVRTLVGRSGKEVRLRDELALEISGDSLASSLDASIEAELTTSLLAHDLEPNRARLQFRGRGAGRRVPVTDEQRLEEQGILSALNTNRSLLPEPPEYRYHDMEWMLCETALVDHIEHALAIVRSSTSS